MKNTTRFALAVALAMAVMCVLFASCLPPASALVAAQEVNPAATLSEISIDNASLDGTVSSCVFGLADTPQAPRGQVQFSWANKLTPASYPATLRAVNIGLNRLGPLGNEVLPDQPYRVAIYVDPENDGPADGQSPAATFILRARGREKLLTLNLAVPLTITGGSFVVAVVDEFKIAVFPALIDAPGKSTPPGSASFISQDAGQHWVKVSDLAFSGQGQCNHPGSFVIRATVESGPVDAFNVTKIKDPAAVEPWGASIGSGFALITNYVSDNLTIINLTNNSVQNLPLGDGPGGTADGPFGVIGPTTIFPPGGDTGPIKAFVTLFGSNTIPTKEFPIDYANVGEGRVVVLTQTAGVLAPAVTINVGKGPRFPALVAMAGKTKLYVPCGGANRVDVIDTATNTKIAEIPVGSDPSSCTPTVGGTKLYVTNFGDGTISVIDTKTDQKIKDIPAPSVLVPQPFGSMPATVAVPLANPWNAAASVANNNLYVTYWGTAGNLFPNGAIAVFDTCSDTFLRATIDDQTRGTPAGSAGASGIAAPASPLIRDAATGMTPGAGGGGGGPFGIAASSLRTDPLVFTNDGAGLAGILDTRIDQVVSSPLDGLAMCAKPRGIGIGPDPRATAPGLQPTRIVAVACGQPDNAVLLFNAPLIQTQAIAGLPVITEFSVGDVVRLVGSGFLSGDSVEIFDINTGTCIAFVKPVKIKRSGKVLLQRGRLTDGRLPSQINTPLIRFIHRDGTVLLLTPAPSTSGQ